MKLKAPQFVKELMRPGFVAIVGRPNVGKSCFFNRLLGRRKAIVESTAGVTRDRLYGKLTWRNKEIKLIDTGGIDLNKNGIKEQVLGQVKVAVEEAELVLLVCDLTSGVTVLDQEAADFIRGRSKKVLLVVNKADNNRLKGQAGDFFRLGLGEPYTVSAIHGMGIGEILDRIADNVSGVSGEVFSGPKFAIIGRPNVGKSSYLNALLEEKRVLVNDRPGTTRDAIDTILIKDGSRLLLIDTAGIKHKSKLRGNLEFYAVLRSQDALMRSDVCLLIIDAYQGLTADDVRILSFAWEDGKPTVLLVNKWDRVSNLGREEYEKLIRQRIRFADSIAVSFCSALKRENILEAIESAEYLYKKSRTRISTPRLNEFLRNALKNLPPPVSGGRRPNLLYITQVKTRPPVFKIFVNAPKRVKDSYSNYLCRRLRSEFSLGGIPIRLVFQGKT